MSSTTSLCIVVTTLLVVSTIFLSQWSLAEAGRSGGGAPRLYVYDNAKVLAMWLVIFGHSADRMRLYPLLVVYGAKIIHMPLFSFVSGLCSKSPPTTKRVISFIQSLVIPSLLWWSFANPLLWTPGSTCILGGLEKESVGMCQNGWNTGWGHFSHPDLIWLNWYLGALMLWRASVFLIWWRVPPSVALGCMIAFSCILGYFNFQSIIPGPFAPDTVNAYIGFLPYFAIGYVFPVERVMQAVPEAPLRIKLAGLVFLQLWIFGVTLWDAYDLNNLDLGVCALPYQLPDGHCSYSLEGATGWDLALFWTRRTTKVCVDMVAVFDLFFVLLPRDETFFTWVGKYTLYAYLLSHSFVQFFLEPTALYLAEFGFNDFTCGTINIMFCLIFSFVVLLICVSLPFRWMFGWCVEPTWVTWLIDKWTPATGDKPKKPTGDKSTSAESAAEATGDKSTSAESAAETSSSK